MKDLVLTPLGLRVANQTFPCVIGKNGVAKRKRESDGKTPIGGWSVFSNDSPITFVSHAFGG